MMLKQIPAAAVPATKRVSTAIPHYLAVPSVLSFLLATNVGCQSLSHVPGMSWMAGQDPSAAEMLGEDKQADGAASVGQQTYPPPSAMANPRSLSQSDPSTGQTSPAAAPQTNTQPAEYPATNAPGFGAPASSDSAPTATAGYQTGPYPTATAPSIGSNTKMTVNPLNNEELAIDQLTSETTKAQPATVAVQPATTDHIPLDSTISAVEPAGYNRNGGWMEDSPSGVPNSATDNAAADYPATDVGGLSDYPETTASPVAQSNSPASPNWSDAAMAPMELTARSSVAPPTSPPATAVGPPDATAALPSSVGNSSSPWRPGSTSDFLR